ncbi:hypothetical protein T08_1480 [Trichinella sp. T8]|nr:hypothetical protein T08_1480 [Trichinella sp. T8]
MLCMLLYLYGEWKLTGFFSIVGIAYFQIHQMLKTKEFFLVPFATRVRMDVKAFPSRPSVPLLITNSQRRNSILFMTAMKYVT